MIQQSPTEERTDPVCLCCCRRLSEHNAKRQCPETTYFVTSQAAQPAEADGDKLGWHVPENLRWLAEQSDRPGYMPCGALTGVFLKEAANMMEAALAATPKAPASDAGEVDAERAFRLWFFRDLSDEQRRGLIRLILGAGCADECTNHGYQRVALNFILRALATPPAPNDDLRAALEFYADRDGDGYRVDVTNYGLSTEEGEIVRDGGQRARDALAALKENRRG